MARDNSPQGRDRHSSVPSIFGANNLDLLLIARQLLGENTQRLDQERHEHCGGEDRHLAPESANYHIGFPEFGQSGDQIVPLTRYLTANAITANSRSDYTEAAEPPAPNPTLALSNPVAALQLLRGIDSLPAPWSVRVTPLVEKSSSPSYLVGRLGATPSGTQNEAAAAVSNGWAASNGGAAAVSVSSDDENARHSASQGHISDFSRVDSADHSSASAKATETSPPVSVVRDGQVALAVSSGHLADPYALQPHGAQLTPAGDPLSGQVNSHSGSLNGSQATASSLGQHASDLNASAETSISPLAAHDATFVLSALHTVNADLQSANPDTPGASLSPQPAAVQPPDDLAPAVGEANLAGTSAADLEFNPIGPASGALPGLSIQPADMTVISTSDPMSEASQPSLSATTPTSAGANFPATVPVTFGDAESNIATSLTDVGLSPPPASSDTGGGQPVNIAAPSNSGAGAAAPIPASSMEGAPSPSASSDLGNVAVAGQSSTPAVPIDPNAGATAPIPTGSTDAGSSPSASSSDLGSVAGTGQSSAPAVPIDLNTGAIAPAPSDPTGGAPGSSQPSTDALSSDLNVRATATTPADLTNAGPSPPPASASHTGEAAGAGQPSTHVVLSEPDAGAAAPVPADPTNAGLSLSSPASDTPGATGAGQLFAHAVPSDSHAGTAAPTPADLTPTSVEALSSAHTPATDSVHVVHDLDKPHDPAMLGAPSSGVSAGQPLSAESMSIREQAPADPLQPAHSDRATQVSSSSAFTPDRQTSNSPSSATEHAATVSATDGPGHGSNHAIESLKLADAGSDSQGKEPSASPSTHVPTQGPKMPKLLVRDVFNGCIMTGADSTTAKTRMSRFRSRSVMRSTARPVAASLPRSPPSSFITLRRRARTSRPRTKRTSRLPTRAVITFTTP